MQHRLRPTRLRMQRAFAVLIVALFAAFQVAPPIYAQAEEGISPQQQRIFDNDIQYFNFSDQKAGACGGGAMPAGTLPAIIPEPYNGAFTNGGNKHNVAPALVAAIFTEENFTDIDPAAIPDRWAKFPSQHPDPNSGWPTNQFNTMGAFQFIPGTWAAYGDDGDNNGTKDAQNIFDGAAGAANYLAANGGTKDKPPAEWQKAIFAYNHAQWYVDAVMKYYNYYNSGATATPTNGTATTSSCGNTSSNCQADGATATGKLAILCEARKFDPFGYLWGGGHEDPEKFMTRFNSMGGYTAPFRQVVDCSGLVTVSLWNAYHVKVVFATAEMGSHPEWFREIPVAQTQPGDLVWHPGHVEIVSAPGATATFGAHTDGTAPEKQIGDASSPPNTWSKGYVYVGPGSTP